MNVNQIVTMVMRMVMRRLLRGGVNAVGKKMNRGGGAAAGPDGRKTAQRARQAMKLGRRIGRF